ncbi:hypothetical protein COCCADRAFT_28717 [Bipolaris zeicola 26-R-13]|uniref:GP-PDE domain-containing protein n=1 Tax=Cochliobolus carbonum (strain 26-R-13) TaxID=930089 RepID=W6XYJ7_COCC2|nr:uncharacterized protein COCCADRAFT_28717 [Bipolaris zeicola 26-R-13]EUC30370.1 hypothetical protein COCCADRAFT_28717 [Bipolaris zeicola 26-R-13]
MVNCFASLGLVSLHVGATLAARQPWNGTAENSVDAYWRATEAGIECIETDMRLSKDYFIPMVHDSGLGRVTDVGEQAGKEAYNPYTGKGYDPKNAAGVPANKWCNLQAASNTSQWYKTPEEFEALAWVQDAFLNGIQLAFIPVYDPSMQKGMDTLASLKAFSQTNYTISAEIELRSTDGVLQDLVDYVKSSQSTNINVKTTGTLYAPGDIFAPESIDVDRANYTFPDNEHRNNSVYTFKDNKAPRLMDSLLGKGVSVDGHDYRSDFNWIMEQGYNWIIADTPDLWAKRLEKQGKRNITWMLADGMRAANKTLAGGWYKRDDECSQN